MWTLLFATIVLPLFAIALLWRRPRRPAGGWIATVVLASGFAAFSLLVAPWGWFGIGVRYGIAFLFFVALFVSWRRPIDAERPDDPPVRMMVKILIGLFFGMVGIGAIRAHAVPGMPLDLSWPLVPGRYLVLHGGSTSAANMHAIDPTQRYAVDLVRLNRAGMRASGIAPRELKRYAIFGTAVLSPCAGEVTAAVDVSPDNVPGAVDPKNVAGNHVVVRCGDVDVTLAHLQRGSVTARVGSRVASGMPVGRVGNSGVSTEPHLHVHAQRGAEAVPLTFEGDWLVRNEVVRRN